MLSLIQAGHWNLAGLQHLQSIVPGVSDPGLCCDVPLAGGALNDTLAEGDLVQDPHKDVLPLEKLS